MYHCGRCHLRNRYWSEPMCSECADAALAASNVAKCIKDAALEEMRVRAACNRWAAIAQFKHRPYRTPGHREP